MHWRAPTNRRTITRLDISPKRPPAQKTPLCLASGVSASCGRKRDFVRLARGTGGRPSRLPSRYRRIRSGVPVPRRRYDLTRRRKISVSVSPETPGERRRRDPIRRTSLPRRRYSVMWYRLRQMVLVRMSDSVRIQNQRPLLSETHESCDRGRFPAKTALLEDSTSLSANLGQGNLAHGLFTRSPWTRRPYQLKISAMQLIPSNRLDGVVFNVG
jgi:hypothetical protein